MEFEILIGNQAYIQSTLETYESTKDAHSLVVLGMDYDGSLYYVLVMYRNFPR